LKSDPLTQDIPVIVLTIVEDHSRGYALGAAEYVTKPIDWDRLAAVLGKYCDAAAPILIGDDDPLDRAHAGPSLALAGWTVREAGDGNEALRLVAEEPPAVILLDLMMPGTDGFQFLEELRQRPEGATVPVVVVTAKELTEEDRQRLSGGVAQVLSKGAVSRDELLARLRDYLAAAAGSRVAPVLDSP